MARPRKRHQQASLRFPDKNGQNRGRRVGEKWRGAKPGRKPKIAGRPGSPHKRRPVLKSNLPVHVVLRVNPEVGSMRKRHMYRALRWASIAVAIRELQNAEDGVFRIVHVSIQRTHVHLIVEAGHARALSNGIQRFSISAAKHINREFSVHARLARRRRGKVFVDRFHQEIITSPRQARHTLAYVLNNWRKHREDRNGVARTWSVDPFSTGVLFTGWKERAEAEVLWRWRDTYDPLVVYLPRTWLLREGWRKYGAIAFRETPREARVIRARPARARLQGMFA